MGASFERGSSATRRGVLVVAPALLTWVTAGFAGLRRRELFEGAVVMLVLAILAELPPQRDVPFIVFPVLLWAALRFGPRGAATAILVVCSITVWNTAQSDGPFVRDSITDSLLATQLFIATSAITSLVLAAVTAERTRARGGAARARRRAGGTAPGRDARRRRSVAEPRLRAVTEEVGRLLGLPGANVMQLDGPGTATVVGAWSEDGTPRFPVGAKLRLRRRHAGPEGRAQRPPAARGALRRRRAGPSPRRCAASATAPAWPLRSASAAGCGACWRR